jgi:hypothetical protein
MAPFSAGQLRLRDDARATPDDVRNPSDGDLNPKGHGAML